MAYKRTAYIVTLASILLLVLVVAPVSRESARAPSTVERAAEFEAGVPAVLRSVPRLAPTSVPGSGPPSVLGSVPHCEAPVVLDRIVDGTYAVFLVGPDEVEFTVRLRRGYLGCAKILGYDRDRRQILAHDQDAATRARVEAKLHTLRQRGSRLPRPLD